MKKLTQLVLGTMALFITVYPFPSSAQVIEPITGLAVFDANGTRVGPVVGVWSPQIPGSSPGSSSTGLQNGGVWFSMQVDDITVLLAVDQNSMLYGTGVDEMFFESAICSGTPLFRTSFLNSILASDNLIRGPVPGQVGGAGNNIIFVPDPNALPQTVTILAVVSGVEPENCNAINTSFETISSIPLIDIDAVFTRPFQVQPDVAPKKGGGPKK